MFEHYRQPLLTKSAFLARMTRCIISSLGLLAFTLSIGTVSLHGLEHFSWLDALLNSVLIMTGLGLVNGVNTTGGKLFTAFYALLSAMVFFAVLAILIAPLLHRMLHRLHLDSGRDR